MRILEILLFTNELSRQEYFFENTLGFDLLEKVDGEFSVQVGWTKLKFRQSARSHKYHYCFLIPSLTN